MKKLFLLIAITLPLLLQTSCKKEDSPNVDYPATYVYDGYDENFTYYTYLYQNNEWTRVENTPDLAPDLSSFSGTFESVTLNSATSLTVVDDGETFEEDYEFSNGIIAARVYGQRFEFEVGDFSELEIEWINTGPWDGLNSAFVSAYCGDEDCDTEEGINSFFFDVGSYNNPIYVFVLKQRFVRQ